MLSLELHTLLFGLACLARGWSRLSPGRGFLCISPVLFDLSPFDIGGIIVYVSLNVCELNRLASTLDLGGPTVKYIT